MKYTILFIGVFYFLYFPCNAQPLVVDWQQCYGGSDYEIGYSVQKINNGFMVFSGTSSIDGQVHGNHGMGDYWLIRTDLTGNILWQKCYGGNDDEGATKMISCLDGGFLLCGETFSQTSPGEYNGDVYNNHGSADYWVVKFDSLGTVEWSK